MTQEQENVQADKVPDFIEFCSDMQWEVPAVEKDEKNENRKRTGAKEGLYPPLYYAGQYTDLWKVPAAADAVYYQSINKNKK